MILSVLIPTHNYDCSMLVDELMEQLPAEAEIIVGDDGSTDVKCINRLRIMGERAHCRVWRTERNLGRAGIRNRLADEARGEWLVFLDSDARMCRKGFLETYLEQRVADVVCGGTVAPDECPSPQVSLRYRYERSFWQGRTAKRRSTEPYASFTTFNFMVRRSVFQQVRFQENCREYGHEDTIFGKDLERKLISIKHIDNPMIHAGLENNAAYLVKTEEGLHSLHIHATDVGDASTLLRFHHRLKRWHITPLVRLWHRLFGRWEVRNLKSATPSLTLFKLYKLGYYEDMEDGRLKVED